MIFFLGKPFDLPKEVLKDDADYYFFSETKEKLTPNFAFSSLDVFSQNFFDMILSSLKLKKKVFILPPNFDLLFLTFRTNKRLYSTEKGVCLNPAAQFFFKSEKKIIKSYLDFFQWTQTWGEN